MLVFLYPKELFHLVWRHMYTIVLYKSQKYTPWISVSTNHRLVHYMHCMDTTNLIGLIVLTFALGAGFGYYLARIFFGV